MSDDTPIWAIPHKEVKNVSYKQAKKIIRDIYRKGNDMKTAATVTIHKAADMDYKGRMKIARWLHRQARLLESKEKASKLAHKYVARWEYTE